MGQSPSQTHIPGPQNPPRTGAADGGPVSHLKSVRVAHHINRVRKEKHLINSKDTEKHSIKVKTHS